MKKIIILLCLIVNFSFAQQASFFRGSSEYYADAYKSKLSQYITLTKTQCDAIDTLFGMLQGRIQVGSITNTRTLLTGYRQASFLTVWGNANANAISLPPYNYSITYYNSPTHASDGVAWNGSNQYGVINVLPTFFNLKAQMSYYSQTNTINTNGCDMGIVDAPITKAMTLYTGYQNKNRTSQCDPAIICSTAVATYASGMFISNQNTTIGNLSLYGRDALLQTATSSGTPFNTSINGMAIGAGYLDGTGFTQFSTHKMAFCSIGDSFDTTTDLIQYSKIINYFMKKLGINAY